MKSYSGEESVMEALSDLIVSLRKSFQMNRYARPCRKGLVEEEEGLSDSCSTERELTQSVDGDDGEIDHHGFQRSAKHLSAGPTEH